MTLSVIIPVYNAQRYLCKCLDSVLAQTQRDFEIICVDDGSTDGSAATLAEYAARDPRVRVLTQGNAGQGSARNRGLSAAAGEFVYFMDADDELAGPGELEYLVGEMKRDALDLLFFDAETRFDPGCVSSSVNPEDYIRHRDYSRVRKGTDLFVLFCSNRDYTVSPCLVISRREFLRCNDLRFAEGVVHEDNAFMLRAILLATRVSHRRRRAYIRYVHEGSTMTTSLTVRNLRGYVACYLDGRNQLAGNDYPCRVRRAIIGRLVRHRLQIGKIARFLESSEPDFACRLTEGERAAVQSVLCRNRLVETIASVRCCLRDRGLVYTLKRVCCFGGSHG